MGLPAEFSTLVSVSSEFVCYKKDDRSHYGNWGIETGAGTSKSTARARSIKLQEGGSSEADPQVLMTSSVTADSDLKSDLMVALK